MATVAGLGAVTVVLSATPITGYQGTGPEIPETQKSLDELLAAMFESTLRGSAEDMGSLLVCTDSNNNCQYIYPLSLTFSGPHHPHHFRVVDPRRKDYPTL